FASADEPGDPSIASQLSVFHESLEVADKAGLTPEVRHIANSAALLTLPEARFDLVRGGIASYGLCPIADYSVPGLRPVMTLESRIALTKRAPAGSGVSYGHRYFTDREATLALVPLGYADGVPRAATNRGRLLLGGKVRTISGTVCMDQFVVDVGDDAVEAGEYAVLFGDPEELPDVPTAEDWAQILDTIPYEIVTSVGAPASREWLGDTARTLLRGCPEHSPMSPTSEEGGTPGTGGPSTSDPHMTTSGEPCQTRQPPQQVGPLCPPCTRSP